MILIALSMIIFCIFICLNLIISSNSKEKSRSEYIIKLEEKVLQLENISRIKLIDDIKLQEKINILKQQNDNLLKLEEERKKLILDNNILLNSLEYEKKNKEETKNQMEYFIERIKELEKKS